MIVLQIAHKRIKTLEIAHKSTGTLKIDYKSNKRLKIILDFVMSSFWLFLDTFLDRRV